MKVVAFHHARHVVTRCQLDHAARTQWIAPFAVVANLGFGRVQHQAGLAVVGFGVDLDLLGRKRWAGAVAPRWVANQRGEVANQENHRMAQILQLAHLVQHHCVTDMDVWGGRVQPQLDTQRHAGGFTARQFFGPFVLRNQLVAAPQGDGQGHLYTIRQGRSCNRHLIHKGFSKDRKLSDRYNCDFPTSGRHFRGRYSC